MALDFYRFPKFQCKVPGLLVASPRGIAIPEAIAGSMILVAKVVSDIAKEKGSITWM